jgi:hypothetical protein
MSLTLPDWVPWWVPLVLLLPALLYGLAFLFMPFSVIGLKSRMEAIEARLDEIQQDIRMLTARGSSASVASIEYDDVYVPVPPAPRRAEREPSVERPPIPPASHAMYDDVPEDRPPPPPHTRPVRRAEPPPVSRQEPRTEPRLNWPR